MILRTLAQRNSLHGCFTLTVLIMLTSLNLVSPNQAGRNCDIETFRSNLAKVCAVYIKRSATEMLFMVPLVDFDNGPRKSPKKNITELARLWGYYLKDYKKSQNIDDNDKNEFGGYLYQLSEAEQEQLLIPPHRNLFHPSEEPYVEKNSNEQLGIPIQFRVIDDSVPKVSTSNLSTPKASITTEEPFVRMRRNPMLQSLVVRCCSHGCSPNDFVVVAHEYEVCK